VILVNYNGLGWTVRALDSVAAQRHPSVEVLVVDSGSSDASPEEIEAWMGRHPQVHPQLLRFRENIGFAVGCNRAFERSRGELLFLLNNDALMQEGVLDRADAAAREHPEAGSFMCSMRFLDSPERINSTGVVAFWDGTAMDRNWMRPLEENPREVVEVLGPCGGAAVWRREVLEKVGFLDEEFFMYSEDVDLAMRARRAGYVSLYLPDAVVLHKGGATAARAPKIPLMEIQYRNVLLLMTRNFPALARVRGWIMYFARFATGFRRHGWTDTHCRFFAIRYVLARRERLAQERRAIRALGPDARVMRWTFLTEKQHP
jgi:GT2 family glycosyltransferase